MIIPSVALDDCCCCFWLLVFCDTCNWMEAPPDLPLQPTNMTKVVNKHGILPKGRNKRMGACVKRQGTNDPHLILFNVYPGPIRVDDGGKKDWLYSVSNKQKKSLRTDNPTHLCSTDPSLEHHSPISFFWPLSCQNKKKLAWNWNERQKQRRHMAINCQRTATWAMKWTLYTSSTYFTSLVGWPLSHW